MVWDAVLVVLRFEVNLARRVAGPFFTPADSDSSNSFVSELGQLMACRSLLIAVLLLVSADQAVASWWIVRASDETCLVVDIEPTGNDKGVTKLGKDVYQTSAQAEADVQQLCQELKAQPKRDPGTAE